MSHDKTVVLGSMLEARARFLSRKGTRILRAAKVLYWTNAALRTDAANERAQFHERGVVLAGVSFWQQFRRLIPELFASGAGVDGPLHIEES